MGRGTWVWLLATVTACSFVRDPDDFTIVDGGLDGTADAAAGNCTEVADCTPRARSTATCEAGSCVYECETGFDDCDGDPANGCEVDVTRDVANCGACGAVCDFQNAIGACTASSCMLMECRDGFEDCDSDPSNGCEANLRSTLTCGACDTSCAAGELCDSTGANPVCSTECDGTVCGDECVDTATNPQRCGDCDTMCPVPDGGADATCSDSACGFICLSGREDCNGEAGDGCEIDTTNDLANCGGCGAVCDDTNVASQSCDTSACSILSCDAGFDDCNTDADDGCETDLATDTAHCGACGNACAAGTVCRLGVCDPVVQVARGEGQGCLVRESGRVVCWGENDNSQAGIGAARSIEVPRTVVVSSAPGAGDFLASFVAGGNGSNCAIDPDGELWCWGMGVRLGAGPGAGNTPFPQPVVADTEPGTFDPRTFVALDSNEGHSCAIDDMGTVWCWGLQQNGCVPGSGDADGARRVTGLPASAVDVAVTNGASCAALTDGSVWCWGTNNDGQLGDGTLTNSATPVQVSGLTGATRLDGMWRTFCAIHDGGRLSCWGNNTGAQIGARRTGNREQTPVQVAPSGVTDVWQSLFSVCWSDADGVKCQGRNYEAQFGDGTNDPFSTNGGPAVELAGLAGFTGFDAGRRGGCGIRDGEAYCWGASFEGSVPRDTIQLEAPTPVAALGGAVESAYTDLSVGSDHACAIRTGIARCWGNDGSGAIGDDMALSNAAPRDVLDLTNVVDICTGRSHTCAIEDGGSGRQAYCWGSGGNFKLGSAGSSSARPKLVEAAGEEVAVACGSQHSCAIDASGGVLCWGSNSTGQLGRPPTAALDVGPTATTYTDAVALALGHLHSCVLRSGGTVECWGENGSGQLGDGTNASRHTGSPVAGLTNVTAIAASQANTCALQATGQVRCWGAGFAGQNGNGTGISSNVPVLVDYTAMPAVAIAMGSLHGCAAYVDGTVRCWGDGQFFQTTSGTTELSPILVPGLSDVTQLSAGAEGAYLTCGLQGDGSPSGTIRCWGYNAYGGAGNGESIYYAPTRVVLP